MVYWRSTCPVWLETGVGLERLCLKMIIDAPKPYLDRRQSLDDYTPGHQEMPLIYATLKLFPCASDRSRLEIRLPRTYPAASPVDIPR
jgi:hypothetical protein